MISTTTYTTQGAKKHVAGFQPEISIDQVSSYSIPRFTIQFLNTNDPNPTLKKERWDTDLLEDQLWNVTIFKLGL